MDAALRRRTGPALDRVGVRLHRSGVRAGWVTAAGWVAGAGAAGAAAIRAWPLGLVLWLANRALDGLDGPVARAGTGPTERGAFLDIVADFSVYGGFVVAVAVAEPSARLACAALLLAYYVSGSAFLALSSLLERRGAAAGAAPVAVDRRSLRFVGGLAEGAETVVVYVSFCLLPGHAAAIAWGFTAAVGVTAVQRVGAGARVLAGSRPAGDGTQEPARSLDGMTAPEQVTVTIQYLPGCPNLALAQGRLAEAARMLTGPGPVVRLHRVGDRGQAESEGFAGSPTLLIDGVDPFPRPPGAGFTCRLYPTPDGVQGAPSAAQLAAALRRARDEAPGG